MLEKLKEIGLHGKEALVYLELLKLGTQPASIVAKKANIPKSTANFNLDELVKRGLATKAPKANSFLYTAEDLSMIVNMLEYQKNQKIADFNDKITGFKEVLAEVQSYKKGSPTRPKVTFYEGIDGLTKVYEDTLTSKETIRSFASFDGMHGALPEYFKTYYQRRAEKGILIRSIHPDTPLARKKTKNDKAEWRESALVPVDKYNFDPEIQFYNGKVNIASWREKLGIIIESKEIYKAFTVAFELAWQTAKKIDLRKKKVNNKKSPK